ncbi:IS5 family transposase [Paenibacillus sp. FSL W7-1088]|uniref:IS5 family transposase n=1 Tax=Paenibacillus sp. FSL W7-1088 TaxID=2921695 RepID=UPI00210E34FD|nr:IS5 family transposase [Paenibacillus sp. OK076]
MGRSRGGLTTKIHVVVDALGNPIRFELTPGQARGSVMGYEMLSKLDIENREILADRAHDADAILALAEEQNATTVNPSKRNRRKKRAYDKNTYKERHLIECFFNRVKKYRRLATRYDKTASMFKASLVLISIRMWLK